MLTEYVCCDKIQMIREDDIQIVQCKSCILLCLNAPYVGASIETLHLQQQSIWMNAPLYGSVFAVYLFSIFYEFSLSLGFTAIILLPFEII